MDYREDPLDRLLDSESDEEFGEPVIRDSNHHHARQDVDGNLKSWTAEDFASIYHRFRPHLVRHARRYLSNETQAEEVVQDAFLFLMTALPEIDNELGVLKFLKWKIKYLSLDLIRAESKSTNLEPNSFDQPSGDAPVDEEILRADDAAVIRLALAKLNPRHREALMASVNEEKTTQQLAQELGTNENAARQLVFRARQAFKKALLGDRDTTGLTTNAIISIAIRKAAAEARENATKVGGFILVLTLGAFGLAQLPIQSSEQTVSAQSTPPVVEFETTPAPVEDPAPEVAEPEPVASNQSEKEQPDEPAASSVIEQTQQSSSAASNNDAQQNTEPAVAEIPQNQQRVVSAASVASYRTLQVTNAELNLSSSEFFPSAGTLIRINSGVGLWALVDYDPINKAINGVGYEIVVDGETYFGSASRAGFGVVEGENGSTLTYSATDLNLIDPERNVISEHPLDDSFVTITINTDASGNPQYASLFLK